MFLSCCAKQSRQIAIAVAGVAAMLAASPAVSDERGFFSHDRPDGYFWYRMPEPQKKPEKPEPEPKPIPDPPDKKLAESKEDKDKGPPHYSAAWIRENLPRYRDQAIDNPTRDNVQAYLYLQRLSIDKAQRFGTKAEQVAKTTPTLNETNRRPISKMGNRAANSQKVKARKAVMADLSDRVGFWFFYSRDCTYCQYQGKALYLMEYNYDLVTTAISMDGSDSPEPRLDQIKEDQGQAEQLGVNTPSAVFLVNVETDEVAPMTTTVLPKDKLKNRVFTIAHSNGWISDRQYDSVRATSNEGLLTASDMPKSTRGKTPQAQAPRQGRNRAPVTNQRATPTRRMPRSARPRQAAPSRQQPASGRARTGQGRSPMGAALQGRQQPQRAPSMGGNRQSRPTPQSNTDEPPPTSDVPVNSSDVIDHVQKRAQGGR